MGLSLMLSYLVKQEGRQAFLLVSQIEAHVLDLNPLQCCYINRFLTTEFLLCLGYLFFKIKCLNTNIFTT